MLPCLVANPCLEYGDTQAQETQHDREDDAHERSHHNMSRAAPILKPFLYPTTSLRVVNLIVQVHQPRS